MVGVVHLVPTNPSLIRAVPTNPTLIHAVPTAQETLPSFIHLPRVPACAFTFSLPSTLVFAVQSTTTPSFETTVFFHYDYACYSFRPTTLFFAFAPPLALSYHSPLQTAFVDWLRRSTLTL